MIGVLLILGCVAAWFALNMLIGLSFGEGAGFAAKGTLVVTGAVLLVVGFGGLVLLTVSHFGGAS